MNHIDSPPLDTPIKIGSLTFVFKAIEKWAKWFNQVFQALDRPTLTESLTFPATASGASAYHTVTFPANTFTVRDSVILTAPSPVSGTAFSAYINLPSEVVIAFENFSGGIQSFPLPSPFTVTIMRN